MKKKQLFSLRKLSVGIASVSLGTLVFLGGAQAANAEDAATAPADKDAQAVNAQVELAKKAGAEQEAKENAQNVQKQVELAQKVAAEQATKAQVELAKKAGAEQEAKELNKKTQDAYNTINNLPNLSNAKKDAYIAKVTEAAGNNKAANIPEIVKDAKAEDYQVGTAKKVAKEQEAKANVQNTQKQVELAQKVAGEQVQKAQAEVNALSGISKETKAIYNNKIAAAAVADIPTIVKDAKAVNAQVELAQKVAKEQEAKAKAAKELNTLTQVAYNTINNLHNLTDQQKDAFNQQILHDSGNNNGQNINAIVENAKQLDTNNGNEKHAREAGANTVEKKEAKELETLTTVAIDQVKGLHNLTDQQKEAFIKQIKNDSANNKGQNLKGIVTNARQLDTNNGNEKHAREAGANTGLSQDVAEKVKKAHNEVDSLKNLTPEQKAAAHSKLNDDAHSNVKNIDKVVKDAKALDAKQAPKKENPPKNETKNQQNSKQTSSVTTGNGKVTQPAKDQTTKVTTNQKTGQNLAQAKVTKDEAKAQQKAEAAKKQLPETGEQDQVLFGMLAGSLFASAGTLFLVQARRKENE